MCEEMVMHYCYRQATILIYLKTRYNQVDKKNKMSFSFEKVLAIFVSAKPSQQILRSFTLEEYKDIFLNRSTEDLKDYLIMAIEIEEYELCGALKKIIEERQSKTIDGFKPLHLLT